MISNFNQGVKYIKQPDGSNSILLPCNQKKQ